MSVSVSGCHQTRTLEASADSSRDSRLGNMPVVSLGPISILNYVYQPIRRLMSDISLTSYTATAPIPMLMNMMLDRQKPRRKQRGVILLSWLSL